ncbi:MAG: hypothetical protein HYZ22_01185 [Chloroflexi bacterium]|nr:hypothetical protein [Chloroflexota bacterium]
MDTQEPIVEKKAGSGKKWLLIAGVGLGLMCICLVAIGVIAGPSLLTMTGFGGENYTGIASKQLKYDVLNAISEAEGCATVSLSSGQMMLRPEQSTDGSWVEIWQVLVCGESQLYSITFTPDGVGGTYFSITRTDQ